MTCLLRNLYAGQEATVRIGHGTQTHGASDTPGGKMSSLPRRAKAKVQTVISKDEFSSFSELSSASEDDKQDSA